MRYNNLFVPIYDAQTFNISNCLSHKLGSYRYLQTEQQMASTMIDGFMYSQYFSLSDVMYTFLSAKIQNNLLLCKFISTFFRDILGIGA